ncbi:nuclear transport factor 2 family protein [Massilia sp. CF038]|uniref:nuclear transport factor 2 family protein n=1 Tax=Massilia sp. CF038 TaxID=1881045 RepID=UPI00092342F6|nr:nuclear transport factor 2 family protein [Massilia sp. CF038]SHH66059.1 protein of unknown function [Massilia sp. CF038]
MKTIFLACALSALALPATAADPLYEAMAAADSAAFDAFNRCQEPAQLARHASFFSPDVEFYHDNGGVTWTRDAMLANTAKYACGKFRRELIPGSLHVFPIKGFGALVQGAHRFCQYESGKCEGMADFTAIWRHSDGQWQMTRVMSYGHRSVAADQGQLPITK